MSVNDNFEHSNAAIQELIAASASGLENEIGGRDRVKLHGARSAAEVHIGGVCNRRVQLPRFLHAVPLCSARRKAFSKGD